MSHAQGYEEFVLCVGALLVQYVLIKKSIRLMKCIVFGSKNLMTLIVTFDGTRSFILG